MKLASVGPAGRERAAVVREGRVVILQDLHPDWPPGWRGLLAAGLLPEARAVADAAFTQGGERIRLVDGLRLGPPIPDPSKIIAVGLNYRDHAREQNKTPPERPLLFAKAPSCLIGARDPIRLPPAELESRVDAEAELAVVLGRTARNLDSRAAAETILGYTVFNDVSGREAQYGDRQWFRGKSFDTFGPCGPWIVTRDELPDPGGLALESDWNDVPMQRGNTRDLLFGIDELVAYASRQMTLLAGDLIATGTPAGVGVFRDPPVFLRPGDVVTIRLEKVGELVNAVEEEVPLREPS